MAEEEVIDAESGTLNKQIGPVDHLKHLLSVGWTPEQPLVKNFVAKHQLQDELEELLPLIKRNMG